MINTPLNKLREKVTVRWAMENSTPAHIYVVKYMDKSKVINKPHIVVRTQHNVGVSHGPRQ